MCSNTPSLGYKFLYIVEAVPIIGIDTDLMLPLFFADKVAVLDQSLTEVTLALAQQGNINPSSESHQTALNHLYFGRNLVAARLTRDILSLAIVVTLFAVCVISPLTAIVLSVIGIIALVCLAKNVKTLIDLQRKINTLDPSPQ
jgi:hypothetical protein